MMDSNKYVDRTSASFNCEKAFEWVKWIKEIPEIQFPAEWKIKIIPPYAGALIRFIVITEHTRISVYLDAYDMIGCMGMKPYWEIHPSDDDDCERKQMNDVDGLLDAIQRSIDFHKPKDVL